VSGLGVSGGLEAFPSALDADAFLVGECPVIECWSDGLLSDGRCSCGGVVMVGLDEGVHRCRGFGMLL